MVPRLQIYKDQSHLGDKFLGLPFKQLEELPSILENILSVISHTCLYSS